MEYTGWEVNGKSYKLRERVSIWKGKYYYASKLFLDGDKANIELITGITNLHTDTSYTLENTDYKLLYTHDKQSENQDVLGMAVLVQNELFNGFGTTANTNTDVSHTYYAKMKVSDTINPEFYFIAGWEKSDSIFSSKKGFEDYIKAVSVELSNPILVRKIK